MTRTIDAANITASEDIHVIPVLLISLDFSSGFVYVNNSGVNVSYGGNTYLGAGEMGEISEIEEGVEISPYSLNLSLSGIPAAYIAVALGEDYQGRDATISLALLDEDHQVIGAPTVMFDGLIDTMDIALGELATISVTVQSRLVDWDRPRARRYNHEDQIIEYPGDLGFEFVPQMVEKTIKWGQPT
jgi:hypothetical protein